MECCGSTNYSTVDTMLTFSLTYTPGRTSPASFTWTNLSITSIFITCFCKTDSASLLLTNM